jgi:AcrR family transcriptional regulator/DNA-binding MarR family transcriptional regulator
MVAFASEGRKAHVAEMQRSRLLSAAVTMVDELGWRGVSVARISGRARVSRRTFYDLFADLEDCLLAVLKDTTARIAADLAAANLEELGWRERVRTGLWTILSFFDREPELARFCVVQSARGASSVLEYRAEVFAYLAEAIDEGRSQNAHAGECAEVIAEGLVGAASTILTARLQSGNREPLRGVFGDLMGLLLLPYLGATAARQERTRPAPAVIAPAAVGKARSYRAGEDPLRDIPMRLTYRTALVLEQIADNPGLSNRELADFAGIADQGQVSKLLGRLERIGLLQNTGEGHTKGERNVWTLTPTGTKVTQSIRTHDTSTAIA